LYANAHRGKVRKASLAAFPLRIVEEELRRVPSKGWAAMICFPGDPRCHCRRGLSEGMKAKKKSNNESPGPNVLGGIEFSSLH